MPTNQPIRTLDECVMRYDLSYTTKGVRLTGVSDNTNMGRQAIK